MKTSLLLVAVAAALASTWCCPTQAATPTPAATTTIANTCQAAHDADRRVSVSFCSTHLQNHRSSIDADTHGLAETAAAVGAGNADAARYEVETLLSRRRDEGEDPLYGQALERCYQVYGMVRARYAAAREAIDAGRYGDVERELANVPSIAHECDDGFAKARADGAPPFLLYAAMDNTQITLLTLSITSLLK